MLDQCFEMLKKEVLDKKKLDEAMDWMREYVRRGADMSHAAAGQALASATVSVLWLTENPADLSRMLYNPQDGQVGREDFRYAFALHTLRLLIESYEADDLLECRKDLELLSTVEQVACLVKEIAFQGGDLAESLGLQNPDL